LIFHNSPETNDPKDHRILFGSTFDAPDAVMAVRGFMTRKWREEWIDTDRYEVRTTRDFRFTATDGSSDGDCSNGLATAGYLISGVTL